MPNDSAQHVVYIDISRGHRAFYEDKILGDDEIDID